MMFHSFNYPDETGAPQLETNFWNASMVDGIVDFRVPKERLYVKQVRPMTAKNFGVGRNVLGVDQEAETLGVSMDDLA